MIDEIGIDINDVSIPDIRVYQPPSWTTNPSNIFAAPPVTQEVGVPVVDMPGCVEAHEQNTSKEKSGVLNEDDPKGVKVYCDAGVPSFNPLDYNKDELEFKYEAPVPPVNPPPDAPEVKSPEIPKKINTAEIKCPTEVQKIEAPVGTLVDAGKKKIVEYKFIENQCVAIKDDLEIVDQVIKAVPSTGQVTTTVGITVIATAAATATPFLLKAVKPIVKQIIKKIKKALGKEPPKLSQSEIQANKFREKRGLPPLKQPKKKK